MSAIDACMASTAEDDLIQYRQQYKENADYDLVGDTTKARNFIVACRMLLELKPSQSVSGGRGGESVEFDPEVLERRMEAAERWYHSQSDSGVRDFDMHNFRTTGRYGEARAR